MSSIPPGPPPPPPPPPAGGVPPYAPPAASGTIPWENRQQWGFGAALVETAKLFITDPAEAWRRTPEKGEMVNPLLFAIIVSWVGAIFTSVWSSFVGMPWIRMLPANVRERFPMGGAGFGVVGQAIIAPILITIGLFLASAILHVCLMMVGGLAHSTAGFDGTFRALSYSAVADLANIVPFAGGLIAAIWKLVLVVMGFVALHKTTQGKAIGAVLIPLVLCCGCVAMSGVFIAMLAGAMRR